MSGSISGGKQKGRESSVSSGNSSSIFNPIAPDGYVDAWNRIDPTSGGVQGPHFTTQGGTPGVNYAIDYLQNQQDRDSHTLGAHYGDLDPVTAQQVSARQGSEFMDGYKNEYLGDVLDSSLADYDYGVGGAANAFRLGDLGSGGGGSRSTVAAAEMAGQAARGRGALSSGIRSNAFNTAAGLGMQDANRFLSADMDNARRSDMASQYNTSMTNNRQMFDIGQAVIGDQMRDQNALNIAGLDNQGFGQNLDWLGAGNPLIGSQTDTNFSGRSSGNSSGSSKGGGLGFG